MTVNYKRNAEKLARESATRYVWSSAFDLVFYGTQAISPVSSPYIQKRVITPIVPITCIVKNDYKSEFTLTSDDLIEVVMGSDAQVSFILGDSLNGNFVKGVCELSSLINMSFSVVEGFQFSLFGGAVKDYNLYELKEYLVSELNNKSYDAEFLSAISDMIEATDRAIKYCNDYIADIESEIADAKSGRKISLKTKLEGIDFEIYKLVGRKVKYNVIDEPLDIEGALKKILSSSVNSEVEEELKKLKEENIKLREYVKELKKRAKSE